MKYRNFNLYILLSAQVNLTLTGQISMKITFSRRLFVTKSYIKIHECLTKRLVAYIENVIGLSQMRG